MARSMIVAGVVAICLTGITLSTIEPLTNSFYHQFMETVTGKTLLAVLCLLIAALLIWEIVAFLYLPSTLAMTRFAIVVCVALTLGSFASSVFGVSEVQYSPDGSFKALFSSGGWPSAVVSLAGLFGLIVLVAAYIVQKHPTFHPWTSKIG